MLNTKVSSEVVTSKRKFSTFEVVRKYVIIIVLLFCVGIFGSINTQFFSFVNILNIIWQNSYLIVATLGMLILMISGGTDLSAGYTMSLGAVVVSACLVWWNTPVWVAVLAGILVCVILTMINGYLSIKLKINMFMVTLGTMTIYSGVSNIFTGQKAIFNLPEGFKYIGQGSVFGVIPIPLIIVCILVAAVSFTLNKTYFGRYIYAVGGNPEASRLAGIKVDKTKYVIFIIAGALFGIAAILLVSRTGSANASMASGSEFTCITAAVLGGCAIQGGEGKVWSVIVAVFILGILANGMQIIGLNIYAQYIAKGSILIASMGFEAYQKHRAVKMLQNRQEKEA